MSNTLEDLQTFVREVITVIKSANRLEVTDEIAQVKTKLQEAKLWATELIIKVENEAKSVEQASVKAAVAPPAEQTGTDVPVVASDPTTAVPDSNPAGTPTSADAVANEEAKEVAAVSETTAPTDAAAAAAAATPVDETPSTPVTETAAADTEVKAND